MEEKIEKHNSQANTKLMMETGTYMSINPETDDWKKLGNPTPTLPPNDPAQSDQGPCDLTPKQPNTPVWSAQLSTVERLAPDLEGPLDREVRPDRARSNTARGKELRDETVVDHLGDRPLVVHLPDLYTRDRYFCLREKRSEEQGSQGQE